MSTILDALRNTEEKGRGQSLDTCTRILMLSTRRSFSSSPRRLTLCIVGASFILAGFVAGMWIAHKRTVSGTVPLADNVNVEEEVSIVRSIEPASLGSHFQPDEDSDASEGGTSLEVGGLEEDTPFRLPLVSRSDFSASDSLPAQRSPFAPTRPSPQLARVESVREPQVPANLFDRRMFDDERDLERENLTSEPISAPAGSAVSFLQWSPETTQRKAFVKVGDGPLTLVHEGDSVGGYTVIEIQQGAVALRSSMDHFYLRVR